MKVSRFLGIASVMMTIRECRRDDSAEFRAGDTCENVTFPRATGDFAATLKDAWAIARDQTRYRVCSFRSFGSLATDTKGM